MVMAMTAGCYTTPVLSQPEIDSQCVSACRNLNGLGCNSDVNACVNLCERIQSSGYISVDTQCAIAAVSRQDATQCGVACN
jgi:hypothetical protein